VDFLGLAAPEWFFIFIEFPLRNKNLSHLNSAFKIFVYTKTYTWFKLEVNKLFSKMISFVDRYGKTTATVWMSGLHRQDAILDKARHGEELQPSGH